jgi:hypothetical protein
MSHLTAGYEKPGYITTRVNYVLLATGTKPVIYPDTPIYIWALTATFEQVTVEMGPF